jgi:hypothetical protein
MVSFGHTIDITKSERIDQCPLTIDNPVILNDIKKQEFSSSHTEICNQYAVIFLQTKM